MIGQRLPVGNESVRFIVAIVTPPGSSCKGSVANSDLQTVPGVTLREAKSPLDLDPGLAPSRGQAWV